MMRVVKKLNAGWMGLVIFAVGAAVAFAQSSNGTIALTDPLGGSETFATVANNVIYFISTTIAIPLTAIMVLVGAFQITTSAGDPEKFSQGRKTILYAAIGFVIAILATGVTSIIGSLIGTSTSSSSNTAQQLSGTSQGNSALTGSGSNSNNNVVQGTTNAPGSGNINQGGTPGSGNIVNQQFGGGCVGANCPTGN